MPEFVLNTPPRKTPPHAFYALDDFARGYVEAMFFTNGDTGDDRENLLNELGVERLTRASVAAIKSDCRRFTGQIMPDGCFIQQWINRLTEGEPGRYGEGVSDERRAGHLFWYARQGHGVAWTDDYAPSGQPEQATAEGLQEAARAFGESYVETARGWIHVR